MTSDPPHPRRTIAQASILIGNRLGLIEPQERTIRQRLREGGLLTDEPGRGRHAPEPSPHDMAMLLLVQLAYAGGPMAGLPITRAASVGHLLLSMREMHVLPPRGEGGVEDAIHFAPDFFGLPADAVPNGLVGEGRRRRSAIPLAETVATGVLNRSGQFNPVQVVAAVIDGYRRGDRGLLDPRDAGQVAVHNQVLVKDIGSAEVCLSWDDPGRPRDDPARHRVVTFHAFDRANLAGNEGEGWFKASESSVHLKALADLGDWLAGRGPMDAA